MPSRNRLRQFSNNKRNSEVILSAKLDFIPTGAYTDLQALLNTRFLVSGLKLKIVGPSKGIVNGPIRTRFRGRGMEFEEVRIYQPGDDIRTIDWRVTARTRVPHTKLFTEERERPVVILVDQRSNMFFGSQVCFKSVYASTLGAMLGWIGLSQNDRIGALVFNDNEQCDVRPKRGKHAQLELVHRLNEFNHKLTSPIAPSGSLSLSNMFKETLRIARPGSLVLIISDFHDFSAECEQQLGSISRHSDITLFHTFDPIETHWPESELVVSDGKQKMRVSGRDNAFQKQYEAQFRNNKSKLTHFANKHAIPLVSMDITTDPASVLRSIYSGRK